MSVEQGPRPQRRSWDSALLVPWRQMLRPAAAAQRLLNTSDAAIWLTFVVHALLLTATVIVLVMWSDTARAQIVRRTPPTGLATSALPSAGLYWILQERSLAEVWSEWHSRGPIGPAEVLMLVIPVLVLACAAFGAWLHLVTIHGGGSVLGSYERAFRAITSCLGLLWVLTLALGGLMVLAERSANRRLAAGAFGSRLWPVAVVAVPAGIALLLAWISAAVRAARVSTASGSPAPRCEGCGYDLTHVPQERRCPECGLDVEMSLTPGYSRPGCAWEDSPGLITWARTSLALLVRPGVFYRRLKLRTPDDLARRFALWQYVALGFVGAAWALMVSVAAEQKRFDDLVVVPVACFLWVPLGAWLAQQTAGAIGVSWGLARAELADPRALRKVVAYEGIFVWLPAVYTGALIYSFVCRRFWISRFFFGTQIYAVLGAPVELTVLWLGNLPFLLLWVWRYYIAVLAVRWGNF